MAKLFAAAFANSSTSAFSALGIYFRVNPWNLHSSALTVAKYFTSFGSLAEYSFSTGLATIWESVFARIVLAPSAFALLSPSMRPSYSAMLFVALNASLASYFEWRPYGDTSMVEAPAPRCPKALSMYSVHTWFWGCGLWCGEGVQSAMKSANACNFIAVLAT